MSKQAGSKYLAGRMADQESHIIDFLAKHGKFSITDDLKLSKATASSNEMDTLTMAFLKHAYLGWVKTSHEMTYDLTGADRKAIERRMVNQEPTMTAAVIMDDAMIEGLGSDELESAILKTKTRGFKKARTALRARFNDSLRRLEKLGAVEVSTEIVNGREVRAYRPMRRAKSMHPSIQFGLAFR